jgi:hypothetical protein
VLTRLAGDLRCYRQMLRGCSRPMLSTAAPPARERRPSCRARSRTRVAGGAFYDALVTLAAVHHGAELATRDARAIVTYEQVGVRVIAVS